MPYRHPHYRHQQYAPHYGSRKRQGDFSNSYGSRRGQYSGRGRNQKYQRFDRNAEKRSGSGWSGENRSGPNAYDPFYDQSMFEDPWKHLLPQAKEEELPNTTEHSTSDLNSPIISGMSMKPEDPEDGSLVKPEVCEDGSSVKPEVCELDKDGSSVKPEDCELDKDGSSVKPEDCELDKDGSSVKPEVCELDKDGSLVKPEHTELGSEYRNE